MVSDQEARLLTCGHALVGDERQKLCQRKPARGARPALATYLDPLPSAVQILHAHLSLLGCLCVDIAWDDFSVEVVSGKRNAWSRASNLYVRDLRANRRMDAELSTGLGGR